MFYLENKDKNNCTGCRACEKICPKDAIQMVQDSEGFIYPEIDELKCIKCGLCKKVCPNVNSVKNELIEQKVYYGVHKDEEILRKSSSGGAFTAIVEAFCDKDYIIFGCTMNEKFEVYHDYVDNKKDIIKFRKSKYLQSNVKDSYIKVKEFLKNGKKVIFTGTPCQISGLKNFLGNIKQEKLLCVDLICHGVTSQKVFNSYIDYLEKKYNSKVLSINFREKTITRGKYNSRNLKKIFNNRIAIDNSLKDPYLRGYHNKLFYRKSCDTCKYSNSNRVGDITIADCWGISKIYPNMDVHKGVSLIVFNTKKGIDLFNNINKSMEMGELSLDFAIKENEAFRENYKLNKNRDLFFNKLDTIRFDRLINKCVPINYLNILKRNVSKIIPKNLKSKIKKVLKKYK